MGPCCATKCASCTDIGGEADGDCLKAESAQFRSKLGRCGPKLKDPAQLVPRSLMLALRTRGPSRNAPNLQTSIFGTPEMTQVNWFGEGARARLPERLCHVLPARAVDAECVRRASGRFGPRAPQGRGDLRYGEADLRSPAIAASGVCPTPPTAATVVRGGGRAASTERMGTPPTARNWKGEKTALTVEPPPSVPPPTSRVGARSTMRGETPASSGDPGGGGARGWLDPARPGAILGARTAQPDTRRRESRSSSRAKRRKRPGAGRSTPFSTICNTRGAPQTVEPSTVRATAWKATPQSRQNSGRLGLHRTALARHRPLSVRVLAPHRA